MVELAAELVADQVADRAGRPQPLGRFYRTALLSILSLCLGLSLVEETDSAPALRTGHESGRSTIPRTSSRPTTKGISV